MTLVPVAAVLAGGMMLSDWRQFHWALPFTVIGAASAVAAGLLLARLLKRRLPRMVGTGLAAVGAFALAVQPADLDWSASLGTLRGEYFVGGLLALLIAVVLPSLAVWFLLNARDHRDSATNAQPRTGEAV